MLSEVNALELACDVDECNNKLLFKFRELPPGHSYPNEADGWMEYRLLNPTSGRRHLYPEHAEDFWNKGDS